MQNSPPQFWGGPLKISDKMLRVPTQQGANTHSTGQVSGSGNQWISAKLPPKSNTLTPQNQHKYAQFGPSGSNPAQGRPGVGGGAEAWGNGAPPAYNPSFDPATMAGYDGALQATAAFDEKLNSLAESEDYQKGWVGDPKDHLNLGRTPDGGAGIQWTMDQLGNLPGKYNPVMTNIKNQAAQALTGLGGWSFNRDDPLSSEREDLQLMFEQLNINEEANRLFREQEFMHRQQAAQREMENSSFARRNLREAFDKLNQRAQDVVRQYGAGIMDTTSQWSNDLANLNLQLTQQYGEAGKWLAQNPPPMPPDEDLGADGKPGVGGAVHSSWAGPPNFDQLGQKYPGYIFQVNFDGEKFTTIAKKPPGDKMFSAQEWNDAAHNQHHNVWSGYHKPSLSALQQMYPGQPIGPDNIREVRDEHGNKKWEVHVKKGPKPPAPAPAPPPPPGPAPGPAPAAPAGPALPANHQQHFAQGHVWMGGGTNKDDVFRVAQLYTQVTGQEWTVTKQGGRWKVYRK